MGSCKYDEQTGSKSDITILVYLQLVCGANPVCPVNIALVPVSSSHPSFTLQLSTREQGASLCSGCRSTVLMCTGETSSAHEPSASVKTEHNCGFLPAPSARPLFSSWEGRKERAQECCFLSEPVSEKETLCWIFFFFSKKQVVHQICNQVQIGMNARSKWNFPSWQLLSHLAKQSIHVPDMTALPEPPWRAHLVFKFSTPFIPGCWCPALTFPKSFRWVSRKGVYLLSWGFTRATPEIVLPILLRFAHGITGTCCCMAVETESSQ